MTLIFRERVSVRNRRRVAVSLFGVRFLWLESFVYDSAASICPDVDGSPWDHYTLSNGGFYMAPRQRESYQVETASGFERNMSADAFGLGATLCAFQLLAHSGEQSFASLCAEHYSNVTLYVGQHAERDAITAVISGS